MTSTKAKNSNKNIEYKIPNKLANTSREPNSQCENSIPAKPKKTPMFSNPTLKQTTQIQNNSPCKGCHLGSRSLLPSGD